MRLKIITLAVVAVTANVLYAQDQAKNVSGKHLANGLTCKSCHETTSPASPAKGDVCIGCHGEIVKITSKEVHPGVKANFHDSHYGEIDCTSCHGIHKGSRLFCNECHSFNVKVK